jgi:hypothetical protein
MEFRNTQFFITTHRLPTMSDIHKILIVPDTNQIATCGIIASILAFIVFARIMVQHRNEFQVPLSVPAAIPIPYIGHAFGLMRRRIQYFSDVGYGLHKISGARAVG